MDAAAAAGPPERGASPEPAGEAGRAPADDEPRARAGGTRTSERLWQVGRLSWALLGAVAVAALVLYALTFFSLVTVPVVLALFPAALLVPVAGWLRRRGLPPAAAAVAAILAGILLLAAVVGAMVPVVVAELPDLAASAGRGVAQLEELVAAAPLGRDITGLSDLLQMAREQVGEVGNLASQAMGAAMVAFETVAGLVLILVVLFFYLKDGPRLAEALVTMLPAGARPRARQGATQAWDTLGSYFRGLLLIALVDAVLIGIGLLVLGVPLAIPLAVLIFFGGLFPIVGAVLSGTLAVLVALADAGLTIALVVLGLVLAVQQLESNIFEPLILSRVIHLHPLVVLLSITAGGLLAGLLGAFLAVPVAAIVARVARRDGGGRPPDEPGAPAEREDGGGAADDSTPASEPAHG